MPRILQAQNKKNTSLPKARKFRVLAGKHHQSERVGKTEGGQPILKTTTYLPGEIVTASVDLVKLHGKDKYAYADDNAVDELVTNPAIDNPEEDALEEMTIEELKAHAEAEEIDLGGATRKADIVAKIRHAQG